MKNAHLKYWITLSSQKFWRIWLLILALAFVVIAVSMIFIDQKWAQYFGSPELIQVWLFHRNITEVGKAELYIVLAIAALFFDRYRRRAKYFLTCMLGSGLALHVIKFFIGRARPHVYPDHNPFVFKPFSLDSHFQGMPSGHSQTLFTIACFVSFLFPKSTPWIFLLALYLSSTRAITLAHFVSDVWAGAFLAVLTSAIILRYLVQKNGS